MTSRTRVLLSPSAFYPSLGGVEEICRNLGKQLLAKGFEVAVAVNRHPHDLPEQEIIEGLITVRFPFRYPARTISGLVEGIKIPLNFASFSKFLAEFDPDILHVICPSSNSLYCRLAQLSSGVKTVVTLQGEFFMDAGRLYQKSVFARMAVQQLLGAADVVTACSQYVLNDAKARFRFSSPVETVIFNGVDLTELATPEVVSLPLNPFILGVGRIVENKGFDWLLRSYSKLAANSSLDLVLAGDGPELLNLKNLANELGISNRVHFVGRQNRGGVTYLFQNCQFFVLPSHAEPFGIVCLEAMRAGKPIVAGDIGGPPEFIQDCGVLVKPLDDNHLYEALRTLSSDDQLRKRFSERCKEKVSEFEWKLISEKYVDIYSNLLGQQL